MEDKANIEGKKRLGLVPKIVLGIFFAMAFMLAGLSGFNIFKQGLAEARRVEKPHVPGDQWIYRTDDGIGGARRRAMVVSSNEVDFKFPYNGPQRAGFNLRPDSKEVFLVVEKGQFLCGQDGCDATIRFDADCPLTFHASADNTVLFLAVDDYNGFITKVRAAKRVRVQARFYQEGARVFLFDVEGLQWPLKW